MMKDLLMATLGVLVILIAVLFKYVVLAGLAIALAYITLFIFGSVITYSLLQVAVIFFIGLIFINFIK